MLIALLTGAGAAYGLARFRFPGRRPALLACLALAALPPPAWLRRSSST
ncbi:MAG: hypothetical protein HC822_02685 [Oscillochloris sp.]|nr:hypothetical protein [Oscillochloris sp.]